MKLTVGFIPSAYEPRYIVGVQEHERQPHSARVFLRTVNGRGEWAIPVGTLYTSDPDTDKSA